MITIMIELETKWQHSLQLLSSQPAKFIKKFSREEWLIQSGLVGEEHVRLFAKYLRQCKKIIPVKVESIDLNKAEQKTAQVVSGYVKRHPGEKILLVMGNLHIRKYPFIFNKAGKKKKFIR